jgi:hypothetical protein
MCTQTTTTGRCQLVDGNRPPNNKKASWWKATMNDIEDTADLMSSSKDIYIYIDKMYKYNLSQYDKA